MEKYESLIAQVNFKLIGISAYNREQVCEWTRKDIGEDVILRKGEMFYFNSTKYKITDITFTLRKEKFERKSMVVFTEFDNNYTNCDVNVFAEIIE